MDYRMLGVVPMIGYLFSTCDEILGIVYPYEEVSEIKEVSAKLRIFIIDSIS